MAFINISAYPRARDMVPQVRRAGQRLWRRPCGLMNASPYWTNGGLRCRHGCPRRFPVAIDFHAGDAIDEAALTALFQAAAAHNAGRAASRTRKR